MTKRVKRKDEFEVGLEIRDPEFINPPRESQRNAVLSRLLNEFVAELYALHKLARGFVRGNTQVVVDDRTQAKLSAVELMEDWQIPLMREMARIVTRRGGDVLEVGFGRGISASFIQDFGADGHTIIECNDGVVAEFEEWRQLANGGDINLVHGLWQDRISELGQFDGILFHTYPLNDEEYAKYVQNSATFAEHFFEHAAAHLKPNGVFTYFSNEIDSLSRAHQRSLLRHFSAVTIREIDVDIPDDVRDSWWAKSIIVVEAVK